MCVGKHMTWITLLLFTVQLEKNIKKIPPLFHLLHLKELQCGLLRHATPFIQNKAKKANQQHFFPQISQILDYKTTIKSRKIYNIKCQQGNHLLLPQKMDRKKQTQNPLNFESP